MATVNKNFRIKHGLIVEGTSGTINNQNILTETGGDEYILNLVGGATLVKSVDSGTFTVDGSGNLTINSGVFDASGAASQALTDANDYTDTALESYTPTNSLDTTVGGYGYLKSGDLPTMYSNSDVDAHLSGGDGINYSSGTISADVAGGLGITGGQIVIDRNTVDSWYDASGAAGTAEDNANSYTDSQLESYTPTSSLDTTVGGYGYLKSADLSSYATQTYADDAAGTAQTNANTYTDNLIGDNTVDGTTGNTVKDRIDSAVSDLVGMAPEALNTLAELAQAFDNNPDTLTNLVTTVGGKQDALTAGTGITLDGATISVTANTYDAYGAAGTAEDNANSYTDTAISNGNSSATPTYAALNITNYTEQVGKWTLASTAGSQVTAFAYSTGWGSAEFLVRVMSNDSGHVHSQLSKILVTTDGSGNVAITEYGIVATNGDMGDITADISGGQVRLLVTPTYNQSEVIVSGTLLAYND